MVGISSFWQIRVIDRPQMPACPGLAALGAATEKAIERPFAIKAKRLKRTIRPTVSHDEFRPIAAGLAYSILRCFHGCVLSTARVPRSNSRAAAVAQPKLSSCGAMSRLRLVGVVFRGQYQCPAASVLKRSTSRARSALRRRRPWSPPSGGRHHRSPQAPKDAGRIGIARLPR